jgi:DNA-binding transcriptional LysR family regulator
VTVGDPLVATRLAEMDVGVYAGRGHPLFERREVSTQDLEKHPFAAQIRPGLMRSVWPQAIKRAVTLQTDSHAVALEACLAGSHLMAMERVIARPMVAEARLREIKTNVLPPARLVLCRHSEKSRGGMTGRVAKAITDTVKALVAETELRIS